MIVTCWIGEYYFKPSTNSFTYFFYDRCNTLPDGTSGSLCFKTNECEMGPGKYEFRLTLYAMKET